MAWCIAMLCSPGLYAQKKVLGLEEMFRLADEQSRSMRVYELGMLAAEEGVKAAKAARLPEVAMTAADHLDGPITIEVPVLDNNFNYWQVGIRVSYNLSSLFRDNRRLRQAKLQVNQAQERYALAQEEVDNAVQAGYVNLRTAFTELRTQEKSVLLAPCDGVTGSKDIHEGQLVQPGQVLVDVVDGSDLWVIANYRETQLPRIREGAEVTMTADAVPGVTYRGVVEAISDATGAAFSLLPQDNATGNFVKVEQRVPVRISLEGNAPEALGLLRAGLNVECKVAY